MFSNGAYAESIHQRLEQSAGYPAPSSSTTRSSFSLATPFLHGEHTHSQFEQQQRDQLSGNPWGAPDMFATDPKLAAFYNGEISTNGLDPAAGLGANDYEYDPSSDPGLLEQYDLDVESFTSADLDAIIASGFLDGAVQSDALLEPPMQQELYYSENHIPGLAYEGDHDYMDLAAGIGAAPIHQLQQRIPSMSLSISTASPSYLDPMSPPENNNIVVHSPQMDEAHIPSPYDQAQVVQPIMDESMQTVPSPEEIPAIAVEQATARYSLIDFAFHHTLGTGSFGRVHLVQSKHNMRFYAIKVLAKEKVVRLKQVEHTNSERGLLGLCKHPFLVNLWGTFQDSNNLFMVMDFVAGGELFTLIRKSVRFPPTVAKFYAAEVATALEYLHSIDIVYRDLKPENILIGQDGHVKLTDFGFAKRVRNTEQTYTMCGTPDYLAPEIILSHGYTQSVDWYAWGVLIFEMLAGHPPFYTKNSDPSQLYRKIIEGHVRFPTNMDPLARDLVANCLSSDLSKRYGNTHRGSIEIFRHPWFSEVDWEMLVRKEIPAPYVPQLRGDGDSSQFEAYAENDPKSEYGSTGPDPFADFFVDFC